MALAGTLGMAGFASFPALMPAFYAEWNLSDTEAGWINGMFFAGYTGSGPLLVSRTDRVDPRRIYLRAMVLAGLASLGFAPFAEGTWGATLFHTLAGVGLGALALAVHGPGERDNGVQKALNPEGRRHFVLGRRRRAPMMRPTSRRARLLAQGEMAASQTRAKLRNPA